MKNIIFMKTCNIISPNMALKSHRDSNLELYRILLMLAIIAHHYVVNSGLLSPMEENPLSLNAVFLWIWGAWGKIGINCFLMITGYFMCKQQISMLKFLKLFMEVIFYNIIFTCIFFGSGYVPFKLGKVIYSIWPFYNLCDDFTACFLIFYLFIPFLNILIQNMTKELHLKLLVLLLAVYSILPGLPYFRSYVPYNYMIWFCVIYLIAAYIRCYPLPWFKKFKLWAGISVFLILIDISTIFGALAKHVWVYNYIADSNTILATVTACSLFLFFKNLPIGYHPWINALAQSVFGVLLIHGNSDAMRRWLWQDVLHNPQMFHSPWLILHAVLSVLAVFFICSAIDTVRRKWLEKPFFQYCTKKFGNISWGKLFLS